MEIDYCHTCKETSKEDEELTKIHIKLDGGSSVMKMVCKACATWIGL